MPTVRAKIHTGVCGFVSEITAVGDDDGVVHITIDSPCPNTQRLAAAIPEQLDAYQEIVAGFDGELWTAIHKSLQGSCSGCVMPSAIFKAMQVAGGVALPADPAMHFERVKEDA